MESPETALNHTKILLTKTESHIRHCVRCHTNYDSMHTGKKHCVMDEHNENEGTERCGGQRGWDDFKYICCGTTEGEFGLLYFEVLTFLVIARAVVTGNIMRWRKSREIAIAQHVIQNQGTKKKTKTKAEINNNQKRKKLFNAFLMFINNLKLG